MSVRLKESRERERERERKKYEVYKMWVVDIQLWEWVWSLFSIKKTVNLCFITLTLKQYKMLNQPHLSNCLEK